MLWAPVVVYMALIFAASSVSHPPELPALPGIGSDKYAHMLMYAGLSALFVRARAGGLRRHVTLGAAALAVLLSTAYGATDEIHQHFVPPRQMDARDLLADGVGATLAAALLYAGIIRSPNGL
jgi:VanZ family protein